jgi:hypothetical protein
MKILISKLLNKNLYYGVGPSGQIFTVSNFKDSDSKNRIIKDDSLIQGS